MSKDPTSPRGMELKLKDHVIQYFHWESMAQEYLELFDQIPKVKGGKR